MHDPCDGCALSSRREFLLDATRAAAAALLALGAAPNVAHALSIGFATGERTAAGSTVTYPLPAQDGVQIDKDNEVMLARFAGLVYAFALSCPHQHTSLRWNAEETRFQCPKHKSRYQPDGTFISGRATRNMDRHALHRDNTSIIVDVAALYRNDKNPAEWAAAVVHV